MKLYQIALRNLKVRKNKMAFMLIGLILASAAVVSIFSIISNMQREISNQLADLGANLVVTADSGELTFQYGGITIPELIFDAATLTEADYAHILQINDNGAIIASAPKLLGTVSVKDTTLIAAGVDLTGEFTVKPWLRLQEEHGKTDVKENSTETSSDEESMEMSYVALNLERLDEIPHLSTQQVLIGANVAESFHMSTDSLIDLEGKTYQVVGILVETGMAEDNQILMNLDEAQALLNKPGELTVIEIAADFNRLNEYTLINRLNVALPHATVTSVRQAVLGRNELLNTLTRFGLFTSAIIIATAIIIIILTMFASVRERTREVGIFRAIGFRSKDIFKVIAFESLVVSLIGGAIGYHLGLAATNVAAPLLTGNAVSASWHAVTFLLVTVLTAGIGILAGSLPAIKAAKLNPAEALRFY